MYKGKSILGIIPARGGSKGLPGKNIRRINGKPLIAWTIYASKESKYLDEAIVSTDSKAIAQVAEKFGGRAPFLRPDELSKDTSASIDVIFHGIQYMKSQENKSFDIVLMLEPTSPLRDSYDIDRAIEQLIDHTTAKSIAGICEVEAAHPDFLITLENGLLKSDRNFVVKRRQELDSHFFYEGSIYMSYIDSLYKTKNFYHNECLGYVVPKWKAFEVDDEVDFMLIEYLLKAKEEGRL